MPRYISIYIEHKKRIKFSEKQLRNRRLKEYLHQTLPSPQIHKFKNYCQLTGAGKSVYSQFALSRHSLRKHLNFGLIPGVMPSSW